MCLDLCTQNLENVRTVPRFLDRIVSGDETWISLYNQETKFESCQWTEKGGQHPQNSVRKTMMTLFHDAYEVLLVEFLPRGETVDTEYYCTILNRLKDRICRKRPGLWERDEEGNHIFWLHQDNATPHTLTITFAFFGENGINLVPHPPYSPDLAPCDFAVFPYLKKQLRGIKFVNIEEVQNCVRMILWNMEPEVFFDTVRSMAVRWKKCVKARGDYCEGCNLSISDISEAEITSDDDQGNA